MNRNVLFFLWFVSLLILPARSFGDVRSIKHLDNGGSGAYKAIAATESSLPNFVIYRPEDIGAAVNQEKQLPVVVFANGGCNDTSLPFERMLSEIASHGYLVIALGAMQNHLDDRPLNKAPNEMMIEALDWITQQTASKKSEYFNAADLTQVAFAGQSCGGAQLLAVASEPRISTYMMFNSGIGDMTMAEADVASLQSLHGPVLYLVGGETDVATANAELDYQRIRHVPVAFANLAEGGHSGTFEEPFGGSFAQLAVKWLNWQLKEKDSEAAVFLSGDLTNFDGWSMKTRNFAGSQ